jgi:hypothetical protein
MPVRRWSDWLLHLFPRRSPLRSRARSRPVRPGLELLEDRTAPAAYIVTNTSDLGPGSLRDAITQVNLGANDAIDFSIGAAGSLQTIMVGFLTHNPLPALTRSGVVIDGNSQSQNPGVQLSRPLIVLDGSDVTSLTSSHDPGLELDGNSDSVSWLTIEHFSLSNVGEGVLINGGTNVLVQDCYLGTTPDGQSAAANFQGVSIIDPGFPNGAFNDISHNVISGNTLDGVAIQDSNNNPVEFNTIGLAADGSTALGNGSDGVFLTGSAQGFGNDVNSNTISANGGEGVNVAGPNAFAEVIANNVIGLDATGLLARPNVADGVLLFASSQNLVSGDRISGNKAAGVYITGGADFNAITGSVIGLAKDNSSLGNLTGVLIDSGSNNSISASTISGNLGNGVELSGVSGDSVTGDTIGLAPDGVTARANSAAGVLLTSGADNNTSTPPTTRSRATTSVCPPTARWRSATAATASTSRPPPTPPAAT